MRWIAPCLMLLLLALADSAPAREWVDSTGKHRVNAELVAVRGDKVVLETDDGRIISIPIARLSLPDRKFLQRQSTVKSDANPTSTPARTPSTDPVQLAKQADQVLKTHCYRCHGAGESEEGGFAFVHDRDKLISSGYVIPRDPQRSPLLERMIAKDSPMPPEGESPRPGKEEIHVIQNWIRVGAPSASPAKRPTFVSTRDMYRQAFRDLQSVGDRDRPYARYFSINHLGNAGLSREELDTYQLALAKLINSLSWSRKLASLHRVGSGRLFRIDLRDLKWSSKNWQRIVKDYPHGLTFNSREASGLRNGTGSDMPIIRADWFVASASRPPLYHELAQIPETDKRLEDLLRIDVEQNIDQGQAVRIGFARSGVSQNNRLIERHESVFGAYWKSYDFADNTGRKNLFENPLGPGTAAGSFQHDGGEIIFQLPNGMLGYMLTDGSGRRIDRGPVEIVSDPRQPDRTVVNGVSCMSCHYGGFIQKSDEIRKHVEANLSAYQDADDIMELYPDSDTTEKWVASDTTDYLSTLARKEIGIVNPTRAGEPIVLIANRYQNELDVVLAAAELGMKPDAFASLLKKITDVDLTRTIGALKIRGGVVKRQAFDQVYVSLAASLQLDATAPGSSTRRGSVANATSRSTRSMRRPTRRPGVISSRAMQAFTAGLQAFERKEMDMAAEQFELALDLSEDDTFTARVYEHVIPIYERGQSISPLIDAHMYLLNLCGNSTQINQARTNFFQSLFRFVEKPRTWTSRSTSTTSSINWRVKLPTSVSTVVAVFFEQQLREDPDHEPSLQVMQLYWQKVEVNPQKRLQLLTRISDLYDTRDEAMDPTSEFELATLLMEQGDAKRAAAIFARHADRTSGVRAATLRVSEAEAWNRAKDQDNTVAALGTALRLLKRGADSTAGRQLERIGDLYMTLDEPAEAKEAYGLALRVEQSGQLVRSIQKKMSDALAALGSGEDDDLPNKEMTELLDPTRSYRMEAEHYEKQTSSSPSSAFHYMSQAAASWIKADEPERAAAALKKSAAAIRLNASSSTERYHVSIAELYQQIDQRQEAVYHFLEALKLCKYEHSVDGYQSKVSLLMSQDDSIKLSPNDKKLLDPNHKYRITARAAELQRSHDARSLATNLVKAAEHWSKAGDIAEVKRVGAKAESAIRKIASKTSHRTEEQLYADLAEAYELVNLHELAVRNYVHAITHADRDGDAVKYHQVAKAIVEENGIFLPKLGAAAAAKIDPLNRFRVLAEASEKHAALVPQASSMLSWLQTAEAWLKAEEPKNALRAADIYASLMEKHRRPPLDFHYSKLGDLYQRIGEKDKAIKAFKQALAETNLDFQKKRYQQQIDALE